MDKIIKSIMANKTTTIFGFFVFLGVVSKFGVALLDNDPSTAADIQELLNAWNAFFGSLGLISARNAWTSSQESGIRPS